MVAYYEDEPSYVKDGYELDQSLYENNNYDLKYPSYKQDSNSYGYDDKYKSKDRDSSVRINKIKCENVNNNFNNVVIRNLSIGNSGSRGVVSDDGINGASTPNAFGNNGEKYYYGYQKDKDIKCVCVSFSFFEFVHPLNRNL